jgi:hypothetical protein
MAMDWLEQSLSRKGTILPCSCFDQSTQERVLTSKCRLDGHNTPLINIAGFTIHPSIRKELPETGLKVADIATGSGAFVRTLSRELPKDSILHGYDISSAAFPQPSKLPENVELRLLDAKQPPPTELHGQYDVIFLRFLNIGMVPDDWAKVAYTAFTMLKPGGSLQWYEGEFRNCRWPLQSNPSSSTAALREAFGMWFDTMPELDFLTDNLSRILTETGFRSIETARNSTDKDPAWRIEYAQYWTGAMKGGLLMRIRAGLKPAPPDEASLDDLVARCGKDNETGGYVRFNTHIWVAVKP